MCFCEADFDNNVENKKKSAAKKFISWLSSQCVFVTSSISVINYSAITTDLGLFLPKDVMISFYISLFDIILMHGVGFLI